MLPATDKNLRYFGFLLAAFILILWRAFSSRIHPDRGTLVLAAAVALSAAVAVLAWRSPRALRFVYRPWMAAAHLLGTVMTAALMTVFYFTALLPFTWIRIRDPLRRKLGGATYWEPHKNAAPTLERFLRPF